MRHFTPDEIERIKQMAASGHSGIAIAKALDRPALAIRKKCVELGGQLRPVRIESKRRFGGLGKTPGDLIGL